MPSRARQPHFLLKLAIAFCVFMQGAMAHAQSSATPAQQTAAVGEVVLSAGEAWKTPAGTTARQPLVRGDALQIGDVLITGDGQLVARMVDGGVLSLRPNTRATLNEYSSGNASQPAAVRITVEKGTLRSATGSIGESQKSKFRVNTPFSALGIRGTDFVTTVDAKGQSVAVLQGAIVLAPFDRATNCIPQTLGPCSGGNAIELIASAAESLRLERNAPRPQRLPGIPDALKSSDPEREFFKSASSGNAADKHSDRSTDKAAGSDRAATDTAFVDGLVRDPAGREIRPFDSASARASFRSSADLASDSSAVGRYYIEQSIRNQAIKSAEALPTLDGVQRVADKAVITPDGLFWFDRTASPVDTVIARFLLSDMSSRLDAFRLGAFGPVGFYSATAVNGLTLSAWVDPSRQQLWGQSEVLSSLMALRSVPEAATIWGVLPQLAGSLTPGGRNWFEDVAARRTEMWTLPLAQQAISYAAPSSANADLAADRSFALQFQQQLRNPGSDAVAQLRTPVFADVTRSGDAFTLRYTVAGEARALTGAASAEGSFFAADNTLELRGQRTGSALLLMVHDRKAGNQWMLGYTDAATGSATSPATGPATGTTLTTTAPGNTTITGDPTQRIGITPLPVSAGNNAAPVQPAAFTAETGASVRWGRWSHFAQFSNEEASRLLGDVPVLSNSHFAIVNRPAAELPTQGRFEFALRGHEAVYSRDGQLRPADVSNASLSVDFNQSRFATRFDVRAPGTDIIQVMGQGSVSAQGLLTGSPVDSNARLQGLLGDRANGASLLFERQLGTDERVSGITHWVR